MLLFSGEESVLFMFILTEVDFFPNAEVDLEQDQKQTELLSGLTDTDREIIQYKKKETVVADLISCMIYE